MRKAFRGSRIAVSILILAMVATFAAVTSQAATVGIDLDGDPSNGDESEVETKVLQSFPVKVENVVVNNTTGLSFTFDWAGAGPGGFSSILVPGPDVGTKWEWTTVSQVYSISSSGQFVMEEPGIPVFGTPPGGFVTPGGNSREFSLPGKSIFPNQVTASTASLTSSLITFFSPENTLATCGSTYTPGVFTQTITNTSGEDLVLTVEQEDCCLEPNQIFCNEVCTSYLSDEENCGNCGITCAFDEFCAEGFCAPLCDEGQEYCGGECVDTLFDEENCGGCGVACAFDEFCAEGDCAPICGDKLPDYCGDECTNTDWDDQNCGECFQNCGFDEFCEGGVCEPVCPGEGQELCKGDCADTLNDPWNCGACFNSCAFDEFCDQGQCASICGEGEQYCKGECADTVNDPANCGFCFNQCAFDEFCAEGNCAPICGGELPDYCGEECTDTLWDVGNCGECGNACAFDEDCLEGGCAPICGEKLPDYCDGKCTDTRFDDQNCGECGNVCEQFQFCLNGVCETPSSPALRESASAPNESTSGSDERVNKRMHLSVPTPRSSSPVTPPAVTPRASAPRTPTLPVPVSVERVERNFTAATPGEDPRLRSSRDVSEPPESPAERRGAVRSTADGQPKPDRRRVQGAVRGGLGPEEAPICDFQDPIVEIIPDGETYVQCQTGPVLGAEIFTRVAVLQDGQVVGEGPCAVFVPAPDVVVDDFYATTTSIILQDSSGDGLLQPGEQADLLVSLVNVGPLGLMNPVATLSGPPDQFNPSQVTVIAPTAFFPDFPPFAPGADCDNPPVLETRTALSPFTIVMPENQEGDVGRALLLSVTGNNVGPVTFELPLIIGVGEKCDPTELDGETYDGLEGFLPPLDAKLVPRGMSVNYAQTGFGVGSLVPLKLKLKCGEAILQPSEIDPEPMIVSLVHDTLGPLPLSLINIDVGPFPVSPFFHCNQNQCQFNMNTSNLPPGTYVVGVEMADTRVFEAGFTLLDYAIPGE